MIPSWFGADGRKGHYVQFRLFDYREDVNIPKMYYGSDGVAKNKFWTDRPLSRINPSTVYFFSPGLRNYGSNAVLGSFCAWVDIDDLDPPTYHLPPSLVLLSGHGRHVYWRFSDFVSSADLGPVLSRLAVFYYADTSAVDVTRFMRWPNSYNHKFTPPYLTAVEVLNNDNRYSLSCLLAAI